MLNNSGIIYEIERVVIKRKIKNIPKYRIFTVTSGNV